MNPLPRWAAGVDVPDWLALREGTRPVIVVAPHGGRRRRAIRRGDSVNDLHTAAIAMELAERLDAHAIVNHGLDRNDIDLNRISHLVARAPGVLALLRASVDHASTDGGDGEPVVPLVVFVHGWNMVVPCCDVGIGLKRRGGVLGGLHPTLSRARYEGTIAAIEKELAARGIASAIGRRYTASGRDNAAQLFSGRHADHEDAAVAALSALAADGKVDAAQLELGIPLRWEGAARDAWIDGLVAALRADLPPVPRPRDDWNLPAPAPVPVERGDGDGAQAGFALQAVLDEQGRVAIFAGVEATGPRSLASRLCVLAADGTMMLLVGEGDWDGDASRFAMDGLQWRVHGEADRIEVTLRGPMVRYRTHDAYLDLEGGLVGSDLVDGEATMRFDAQASGHGRLTGRLRCGELDLVVDATAFLDHGPRGGRPRGDDHGQARDTAGHAKDRIRVMACVPGAVPSVHRSDDGSPLVLHGDPAPLGTIRSASDAVAASGGLREAEIVAKVPVWRPLAPGVFSRWTFGIVRCRFHGDAAESAGLFDTLEIFRLGEAGKRPPT